MLDNSQQPGSGPTMPLPFRLGLGAWMSAVLLGIFLYLPAAKGFVHPESSRIVVVHVPCAMIAVIAYVVSTIYAVAFLRKGKMMADEKSAISAGLGFLFTVLATVTGMVFARVQSGVLWDWYKPRMTSILMLIMVYSAYFMLRSSIPGRIARAKISAAYNILAGLLMPFFIYVMPRMFGEGPHPNDTLASRDGLSVAYKIAMFSAAIGMVWLYIWMFRMQVRVAEFMMAARRVRVE